MQSHSLNSSVRGSPISMIDDVSERKQPSGSAVKAFDEAYELTSRLVDLGLITKRDAALAALESAKSSSGIDISYVERAVNKSSPCAAPIRSTPVRSKQNRTRIPEMNGYMTVSQLAQELTPVLTSHHLNQILSNAGFQYRNKSGHWRPSKKYELKTASIVNKVIYPCASTPENHTHSIRWHRAVIPDVQRALDSMNLNHGSF